MTKSGPAAPESRFELDQEHYPLLVESLREGGELGVELARLLDSLKPPRAPRRRVSVLAKLLLQYRGAEVAESVVVQDVSASGLVVSLPAHLELDLAAACEVRFIVGVVGEASETEPLRLEATLVRLVGGGPSGVQLAYQFVAVSEQDQRRLVRLGHLRMPFLAPRGPP